MSSGKRQSTAPCCRSGTSIVTLSKPRNRNCGSPTIVLVPAIVNSGAGPHCRQIYFASSSCDSGPKGHDGEGPSRVVRHPPCGGAVQAPLIFESVVRTFKPSRPVSIIYDPVVSLSIPRARAPCLIVKRVCRSPSAMQRRRDKNLIAPLRIHPSGRLSRALAYRANEIQPLAIQVENRFATKSSDPG